MKTGFSGLANELKQEINVAKSVTRFNLEENITEATSTIALYTLSM